MKVIELLVVGLVFMAIFPQVYTLMGTTQKLNVTNANISGNVTPGEVYYTYPDAYPNLFNVIFGIVPLLLAIGILIYVKGNTGLF